MCLCGLVILYGAVIGCLCNDVLLPRVFVWCCHWFFFALMCCYHVFLYGDVIGYLCITVLLPCVFVWCCHRVFMHYCVVTTCFVWSCHGVFMHNCLIPCVCKVRSYPFMNLCVVTTCVYMLSFLCIYEAFATVNVLLCDVLCVFMSCCDGLLSP